MKDNIIFTAYFCSTRDPQREKYWEADYMSLILPLYDSVERLGLKMVVFHDNLSEESQKHYTTDNINFEYYRPTGNILTQRFYCYLDYLADHVYDKVLCLDSWDTEVYKDPFPLIDNKILVGSEGGIIRDSQFMHNWFKRAYGGSVFMDEQILNCGILGSTYHGMVNLLTLFKKETELMRGNVDMAVFNKLLHGGIAYTTGYPIHTKFWEEEGPESGCYIRHK